MDIILTHENADFDAVAALLAASRLYLNALPVLPGRLNHNVAHFLTLYQNALPFIQQRDVHVDSVSRVIVVDTQRPAAFKGIDRTLPLVIIDHHPLSHELKADETYTGEAVGAVTTLLVEKIRQQGLALDPLEATLLALGIYEDTGSLTYGTTTPRDIQAAAWLVEQGGALDTVRRFLSHPLSEDQQALLELLLSGTESRVIEGYTVVVASAVIDHHVSEISTIAHRLRDTLDLSALFILVQMPNTLQLTARSSDEAVDVGRVAQLLGGGGHGRAAAAAIHDKSIEECVALIWQTLSATVRSATRVVELMSYGAHTVDAAERLENVVGRLRRIGHEGYPVVEAGQVVGLLTRRDLDRGVEHGLGQLTIGDVMMSGRVTLRPDDSVFALEQRMVESGWGQIPVVDDSGTIIGIVTRTDLIKHWARVHPARERAEKTLSLPQIESILGESPAQLIASIAARAQDEGTKLYLVGGVVRDLLLSRRNLDMDFVLEDNAIQFARSLQARFGGHVSAFPPFGTAKWLLDESVAAALNIQLSQVPEHLDFATARNEFYEHPTALPTVYNGSIKLDLQRRDFTINTLAVQLSPANVSGHILDFYGGLGDLETGQIRVLHSLSFVDDPTRVLRAVRFKRRLAFTIEARTADLISSALPMLGRITGERLRNELTLLLKEPESEQGLLELQERGVLKAIHPAFSVAESITKPFTAARERDLPWKRESLDLADLYWHILFIQLPPHEVESVCERLMFGRTMIDSLVSAVRLFEQSAVFSTAEMKPSAIVRQLAAAAELALLAVWLTNDNPQARDVIRNYWTKWRHTRPITNGHILRDMGVPQGPCYSIILNRVRDARLDGEVQDEASEQALLLKMLHEEGICDDSA